MSIARVWCRPQNAEGNPMHKSFSRVSTLEEVKLGELGIATSFDWHNDKQVRERGELADPSERALLLQSRSNIETLKKQFPAVTSLSNEAAFGENVLLDGEEFVPTKLCIGDVLQVIRGGNVVAVLAITSPRWPCYKVDKNHKIENLVPGEGVRGACGEKGLGGFFCRVLTPGSLKVGDQVVVKERVLPSLTLERVSHLCCGGSNRVNCMIEQFQGTDEELKELLETKQLAFFEWRERLEKYVAKQAAGPAPSAATTAAPAASSPAAAPDVRINVHEEKKKPASVPWYRKCCARPSKESIEMDIGSGKKFTKQEVASSSRCLVIVNGDVFDVTDYVDTHPGGRSILLSNKGKDATAEFEKVGHSKRAKKEMAKWKVGTLTTQAELPPTETKAAAATPSSSGGKTKMREFTAAEVASSPQCLVIIHGAVYDVTDYADTHPGGRAILLANKGKDATAEFEEVGHSKSAKTSMAKWQVGTLTKETKAATPSVSSTGNANNSNNGNGSSSSSGSGSSSSSSSGSNSNSGGGTMREFTKEEVASSSRCLLIIHGDVYDVTDFADTHPGGRSVFLSNKGKDATTEFEKVGHSESAKNSMAKWKVGTLAKQAGEAKAAATSSREFTTEEVASSSRCLVIIHGAVYDVTDFADTHPGGRSILFSNKGKDATAEFEKVGHSESAKSSMAKWKVGTLAAAGAKFTKEEVVNSSRCLVVIHGDVYDVTDFADTHPGGRSVFLSNKGKDVTAEFEKIGHSAGAKSSMAKWKVGTLIKQREFTKEEVASSSRCLLIIHDDVYDVTDFADKHPGGRSVFLSNKGKDVTTEFEKIGHSAGAKTSMAKWKVGTLATAGANSREFTKEEVASSSRCLLIIHGDVYDVTDFADTHPGGRSILFSNKGKDAISEFEKIGHSANAKSSMAKWKVGTLAKHAEVPPAAETQGANSGKMREFTKEEVASSPQCLVIVHGDVYDVTDYADIHPGGRSILFANKGKDATAEFEEVAHSKSAKKSMAKWKVGTLVGQAEASPTETKVAISGPKIGADFTQWTIHSIVMMNHDCVSLTLKSPVDTPIPSDMTSHELIWHLSLLAPKPNANGELICRQYSPLTSVKHWADTREVNFLIKVYSTGEFTRQLKECKAGDALHVGRPRITLSVPKLLKPLEETKAVRIGLMAGGTGICPLLPLLELLLSRAQALAPSTELSIHLVSCNKFLVDVLFEEKLRSLATQYPNHFRVQFVLTREESPGDFARGRVSVEHVKWLHDPSTKIDCRRVVVCGPQGFSDHASSLLRQSGFAAEECIILDA